MQSHPSWVCGLKQEAKAAGSHRTASHPSWVCGLKQLTALGTGTEEEVTPFVGVWIETRRLNLHYQRPGVTPFVGVWIETSCAPACQSAYKVTPFVGVWIETLPKVFHCRTASGHTLRGCVD